MTSSNPKYLLKLYKYNTLLSYPEMNGVEPDDEKPGEDIRYKKVVPEEVPQRKKALEEPPIKDTPGENVPLE